MDRTRQRFVEAVNEAIRYVASESALSRAFTDREENLDNCKAESLEAIRNAQNFAIAIDGLPDRHRIDDTTSPKNALIRTAVEIFCKLTPESNVRAGCLERIRGVAVTIRHGVANDQTVPVADETDIVSVGLGYGLDGYGVGKFSGPEVIVRTRTGESFKFLGDVSAALIGWRDYFLSRNVDLSILQGTTVLGVNF